MKKRFSDEQSISILREAEAGFSACELCRKHVISDAIFYTWRKKFGGIDMHPLSRCKKARHGPGFGEFLCLPLRKVYTCCYQFWLPEQNAHRSQSACHPGTSAAGLHLSIA